MSASHSQRPSPSSIPYLLKPTPTSINNNLIKRQRNQQQQQQEGDQGQQTDNVVHVTVTASGTVVYTYTATSYSYVPTYSTVTDNNSTNNSNNGSSSSSSAGQGSASSSGPNIGAVVGGVVGGIAFIALIGLAFFFIKRSQKKKKTGFDGEEYKNENGPRPFVAPFIQDDPEGGKGGGYYEDLVTTSYPGTHYNTPTYTATTDSLSSGNLAAGSSQQYIYQVPNEIDYPPERHVPHLKENEPPHLRD